MRTAILKQFIGSDLEKIEADCKAFFSNLCPGNLLKTCLYMHNGVYQYEVWYAEFIKDSQSALPYDIDDIIGFESTDSSENDFDFIQIPDEPHQVESEKVGLGIKLTPVMDSLEADPF